MVKRKTILLTGATGFLGSELLKRFVMLDYEVNILVRKQKNVSNKERITRLFIKTGVDVNAVNTLTKKIHIFEGDITKDNLGLNINTIQKLRDSIDEVFHCAAATKFSGLRREDLLKANYTGTKNILKLCVSGRRKHIHYISTAYVSGTKNGIVYEDELDDSFGFRNYYEESKFFAEKIIHEYALSHKLPFTIYRPSIIVGDSRTNHTTNFDGIYLFSRTLLVLKRKAESMARKYDSIKNNRLKTIDANNANGLLYIPIRIPAKPDATINLVPVDYVTNVIISIFLDKNRVNNTFHIVNPYPPKLSFLMESISEAIGITGTEVVDHEEFNKNEMSSIEIKTWEKIGVYGLYMRDEPYFHLNNTLQILNDFCIKCPKITKTFISSLINYAIDNGWGNHDNYKKPDNTPLYPVVLEETCEF